MSYFPIYIDGFTQAFNPASFTGYGLLVLYLIIYHHKPKTMMLYGMVLLFEVYVLQLLLSAGIFDALIQKGSLINLQRIIHVILGMLYLVFGCVLLKQWIQDKRTGTLINQKFPFIFKPKDYTTKSQPLFIRGVYSLVRFLFSLIILIIVGGLIVWLNIAWVRDYVFYVEYYQLLSAGKLSVSQKYALIVMLGFFSPIFLIMAGHASAIVLSQRRPQLASLIKTVWMGFFIAIGIGVIYSFIII